MRRGLRRRACTIFVASAGVAGALVGLLFVAVSVTQERLAKGGESQLHRIRASAALTSFTNALVVSLFAIIPGVGIGLTSVISGRPGAVVRGHVGLLADPPARRHRSQPRDALFLAFQTALFIVQLLAGLDVDLPAPRLHRPDRDGDRRGRLFLIGIARSWELIGGPEIGLISELQAVRRAARGEPPARVRRADRRRSSGAGLAGAAGWWPCRRWPLGEKRRAIDGGTGPGATRTLDHGARQSRHASGSRRNRAFQTTVARERRDPRSTARVVLPINARHPRLQTHANVPTNPLI